MGSIRRKTFTKPLPDGAELFTRRGETFARWKDGNGKTRGRCSRPQETLSQLQGVAADCRRQRRAMTEGELVRLLDVARRRPLLDAATVRRGKNAGKPVAKLRPETVARLELLGRERALTYKTLVLTGLRKGELATLAVGQLDLDAEPPFLTLDTADEKNREGNSIPLRSDLAADLRQWLKSGRMN